MKKSWHPLLLKNQERVWLEEKKAVSQVLFLRQNTVTDLPLPARREEEIGSTAQRERRRKAVTGTSAFARGTDREETNREIGMDVRDACYRGDPESKRPRRLPARKETSR